MTAGAPPGFAAAGARLFAQDGRPPPFLGRRLEQPGALAVERGSGRGRPYGPRPGRPGGGGRVRATGALVNSAGVMLTGGPMTPVGSESASAGPSWNAETPADRGRRGFRYQWNR
ncbi:hypothetical protein [Streptomyces blastmyceticus]|uniref:Uncharacterized protein n=1 Tax=Streptomyces blastmyceticus TaxID=68180 RepID=A0ABP3GMQ1_9ACTN